MRYLLSLVGCVGLFMVAMASEVDPFFPEMVYAEGKVTATFYLMNEGEHLYDDMLACSLGEAVQKPQGVMDADGRLMYGGLVEMAWPASTGVTFTLEYQGCDASQCFMPQSYEFAITTEGKVVRREALDVKSEKAMVQPAGEAADLPISETVHQPIYKVLRRTAGYVDAGAFVRFLEGKGEATFADDPVGFVRAHGLWAVVVLIFLGGVALNLTPCVLPMIPINLAIIGAGAAGGSRAKGALRGGAYGLGIALAYGVLALIPVFTGAAFGVVQSTWWFNAAIAVVFLLLAGALFDLFMIDFARFSGQGSGKQGVVAAFSAGALSAVLAGACVAPVLIAVLLLTSTYFGEGAYWALALPFLLGLGMGLPWPIAGAGLAFLPRPGAWMVWVKRAFGVGVILFAGYYGYVAYKAFGAEEGTVHETAAIHVDGGDPDALQRAIAEAKKPALLDFWGTACKNCDMMEATTFKQAEVVKAMEKFTFIKVKMDLSDSRIKATQAAFEVMGLPTYVIVE